MNLTRSLAPALAAALVLAMNLAVSADENEHDVESHGNQPGELEHDAGGSHEEGHTFFAGAKGSYLLGFAHGDIHHFGGGGVFFEVLLIPHWLEIELCVRALGNSHGVILPIDVLLKIPFHVNEVFHPFIGLGPTVVPSFMGENEIFFGGVVALGSYFWVTHSWAVTAELNYNLIYEHGVVNEVGVNVGVAYGW
ncbi:MAG: hypothetical protein GY854_15430 [Deltaproteobacteria bacterium]|nr:hypothetical protein [Deltaproteobacteria bacterium]